MPPGRTPTLEEALGLWRSGNRGGARSACSAFLSREPAHVDALNLLAEIDIAGNEPELAAVSLARITQLRPGDAAARRRLANAQFDAGSTAEAIASYRMAIDLEPGNARAHNNLGRALVRAGDAAGALQSYRRALAIDANYAIAHNNLGNWHYAAGDCAAAIECQRRAVALKPDFAEAWFNCAAPLLSLKRAADALACCDRALALKPVFPEALFIRAAALRDLARRGEALIDCDGALAQRPDDAQTLYSRANLLREMGDHHGAVAGFGRALEVDPTFAPARLGRAIARIPALPADAAEIQRSRQEFAEEVASLEAWLVENPATDAAALVGAVQPFYLAYQEENNRPLLAAYGRLCANLMAGWQNRRARSGTGHAAARDCRIRVGIVSAQVSDHSVFNAITKGWLTQLDRRRFDVAVFHLGALEDRATDIARSAAGHFEQGHQSLSQWVRCIQDRGVDILLYPEIGMDQATLQLAGMRLAPTQMAAWGHPETTGLPTMDYFLSAESFEPPDAEEFYSERLIRLPNLGCYYESVAPAESSADIERFAIEADLPLLLCAGAPFKYSPQYDHVLIEVAKRIGPCQFLFFEYRIAELSRRVFERLSARFAAAGFNGSRYLKLHSWASTAQFHALMRRADLMLDTLGFSGFNTVIQAVECGLPVVTLRGRFLRGRFGSGILETVGLPELVADSPEDYVDIAASLCSDSSERARVRERLRAGRPTAFRDTQAIEGLERVLLDAAQSATSSI